MIFIWVVLSVVTDSALAQNEIGRAFTLPVAQYLVNALAVHVDSPSFRMRDLSGASTFGP
jgi:hypothetical protein